MRPRWWRNTRRRRQALLEAARCRARLREAQAERDAAEADPDQHDRPDHREDR